GLLAPDLRRGRRQVAVPVVEAQAHATDQRQVAAAGGIADHGHRRDRREADHAIRAVLPDGVDVGGGHDLVDLVPAGTDEAAHAALALVGLGLGLVLAEAGEGVRRGHVAARVAPQYQQRLADLRVLQAVGAVDVAAVARPAGTAARLAVGQAVAGARVVGLLGLPGDQA